MGRPAFPLSLASEQATFGDFGDMQPPKNLWGHFWLTILILNVWV